MKINRNITLMMILLFLSNLPTSTANKAPYSSYSRSWSENLNAGDQFEWLVEIYSMGENTNSNSVFYSYNTFTTYETILGTEINSMIASVVTETQTYTIPDQSTNTGLYGPNLKEGSKLKMKILKSLPNTLFLKNIESLIEIDEYFEFTIDGNKAIIDVERVLIISSLIIPVVVTFENGTSLNYFRAIVDGSIATLPEGAVENPNIDTNYNIENNIFTEEQKAENDSIFKQSIDINGIWEVDTGVLKQIHVRFGGLEWKIVKLGEEGNSSLDLPFLTYWMLYGVVSLLILRKRINKKY